jgi:hypothetical protein
MMYASVFTCGPEWKPVVVETERREKALDRAGETSARQLVRSTRQYAEAQAERVLGVLANRLKCTSTLPVPIARRVFERSSER